MNKKEAGQLYVVATPIGNMQDMSYRAVEVLKAVDLIVAEDTRHSQPLLRHYLINTKLMSLHEHNERERAEKLIRRINEGESIALISDAGTPLISDPGYHLVYEARLAGISVIPLPGACAAIAALSVAGLPSDRFTFEGFLPAKSSARKARFEALQQESRTLIFYESPHRIKDFLDDLQAVWGADRLVFVARELTKLFETTTLAPVRELIEKLNTDPNQSRGEMVVIVQGVQEDARSGNEIECERMLGIMLKTLSVKQASGLVAELLGEKKNAVYEIALKLQKNISSE